MRRVTLVIALAVVMAAMLVLTVGSALAKDTQPKPETYVDEVVAVQYAAAPGQSWFSGPANDILTDRDPGLTGYVDTRITYIGTPGPGVENKITGGSWVLCSEFTDEFIANPLTNQPACKEGSAIALEGNVSRGTAAWYTNGGYAFVQTPEGDLISVYAGVAEVKADFTVAKNGEVNVEGTGKFKGTLDHRPLLSRQPPILKGTMTLKL